MKQRKRNFAIREKLVRGFESWWRRAAEWTHSIGRMTPGGDSARLVLASVIPIVGIILGVILFPEAAPRSIFISSVSGLYTLWAIGYVIAATSILVALTWFAMARTTAEELRAWVRFQREPRSAPERFKLYLYGRRVFGGRTGFLTVISFSLTGLGATLFLIPAVRAEVLTGFGVSSAYVLSVFGALVTWALLHTAFALQYAYLFYDPEKPGGFEFPEEEEPNPTDFAYFAFTVATSYSASDVRVITSRMRKPVMIHSILAFFYYAAIFAIIINIILSAL